MCAIADVRGHLRQHLSISNWSALLCFTDPLASCCRYIVHLSTLQTAATAREDLQQAAQSLADLSSLQVSSSAAGAAEVSRGDDGHSHSAAEPQAASSSVTPAHAAQKNGAHDASEPPKKPRALFLAYYNQVITSGSVSKIPKAWPVSWIMLPM